MGDKYTKLVKNTVIFTVGSFGSKILSFLIVPLYTYVLTTEEYGQIDLFTTSMGLIIPFVTMLIQEALLRFLLAKEINKETAVSNCCLIFILGTVVSVCLYPFYKLFISFDNYIWMFIILLILNSFTQIFSQYLRATEASIAYAVNGVIVTSVTVISNLFFLVVLKLGMTGYLFALAVAQIASAIYILAVGRILQKVSLKYLDIQALKMMLKYSIPLIPNSLMWWLMSAGDKYIINFYLGDSANGIYSLAMKIPTIINMIYSLFFQAWQLSAIEENNTDGRKGFYENVFKSVTALLTIITAVIILFSRPFYCLVMNGSFKHAWKYVPLLSIVTIFSCFSSFFGIIYTTSKNTHKAFYTTVLGAVVNLVFNFIFIQIFGLQGVAAGTGAGYLVVALIRGFDVKKETGMKFDVKYLILINLILFIQTIITIKGTIILYIITGILSILLILFIYKKEVRNIAKKILYNKKGKM